MFRFHAEVTLYIRELASKFKFNILCAKGSHKDVNMREITAGKLKLMKLAYNCVVEKLKRYDEVRQQPERCKTDRCLPTTLS